MTDQATNQPTDGAAIGRCIFAGRRVYRHSIPELRMGFLSAKNSGFIVNPAISLQG